MGGRGSFDESTMSIPVENRKYETLDVIDGIKIISDFESGNGKTPVMSNSADAKYAVYSKSAGRIKHIFYYKKHVLYYAIDLERVKSHSHNVEINPQTGEIGRKTHSKNNTFELTPKEWSLVNKLSKWTKKMIMNNWIEYHPVITQAELGWSEECIRDAMSEDPKEIFNYFWQNFFSIIFYYVDDGNFYELFMESEPHKFWRIPKINNWDGKYIGRQILWENHQEGEVLFEFTDDTNLWETLKVGEKSIGEVLKRSYIAEIE